MFLRSPVCLCGLVKKVVTCWERHLCFVGFSKTHFQQNGFKRGETAKYLKVTRQSWPMLSRRCICLEMFEELHLHASDCLHLSFFMSLFLKPSHFYFSEDVGSSLLHFCNKIIAPCTFFCPSSGEECSLKQLCPFLLERVRSYGKKKDNHQTQRKDN